MRILFALALLLPQAPANAAPVAVEVRGTGGATVSDAVVSLHLVGRPTPAPAPLPRYDVTQKDLQFRPFVLVVPVNAEVAFPNLDPVRHHVYSFSPAKRFELKLYAREQNRVVRFDKAGIVPLGCNIHDQMTAYVNVVNTPWAIRTNAAGKAVLTNIPPGSARVTIWHPYL